MINRLINRLHRVFNKDPQKYKVISISCPLGGTINATNNAVVVQHKYGKYTLLTGEKTLNQMVMELNGIPHITAGLRQPTYSHMLAKGILPDLNDIETDGNLYMPESIFYNEMQVYAGKLQEQADRLIDAEKQLYFHSASDDWLDYWARDYFGNQRKLLETDLKYTPRVVAELILVNQNNKAIEIIFGKEFPLSPVSVADAPPDVVGGKDYYGNFTITINYVPSDGTGASSAGIWDRLAEHVRTIKSAGTRPYIEMNTVINGMIYEGMFTVSDEIATIYPQ